MGLFSTDVAPLDSACGIGEPALTTEMENTTGLRVSRSTCPALTTATTANSTAWPANEISRSRFRVIGDLLWAEEPTACRLARQGDEPDVGDALLADSAEHEHDGAVVHVRVRAQVDAVVAAAAELVAERLGEARPVVTFLSTKISPSALTLISRPSLV